MPRWRLCGRPCPTLSRPSASTATTTTPSRRPTGGEEVWITRKGAIRAGLSDMGVIPGSMGASSFIVRGKGNEASYESSSHGAGRRLGRKAAFRQLTTESLRSAMAGRAWDDTMAEQLVDEHPDAYKPIAQVMADQADLVEVVHELHQVVNLKGT